MEGSDGSSGARGCNTKVCSLIRLSIPAHSHKILTMHTLEAYDSGVRHAERDGRGRGHRAQELRARKRMR